MNNMEKVRFKFVFDPKSRKCENEQAMSHMDLVWKVDAIKAAGQVLKNLPDLANSYLALNAKTLYHELMDHYNHLYPASNYRSSPEKIVLFSEEPRNMTDVCLILSEPIRKLHKNQLAVFEDYKQHLAAMDTGTYKTSRNSEFAARTEEITAKLTSSETLAIYQQIKDFQAALEKLTSSESKNAEVRKLPRKDYEILDRAQRALDSKGHGRRKK